MTIVDEAMSDNPIQGGTTLIAFGSFGSGKSKLIQSWAIKAFQKGHLVIIRSKDVDTWQDLASQYPIHVYTPDIYHFDYQDEENQNIKYTMVRRPDDIIKSLKRDEINVIALIGSEYAQGFFWAWFSNSLVHNSKGWTTFCFDEIRDVFQSHPSGPSYQIYESFVSAMTSFRKQRIHFRASTHTFHDLYYEILYKFNYVAYLKGSILLPKKRTALKFRTPIEEECDKEHYILDNISSFEVVHHSLLPESLATGNTVSIEGPDFEPDNFPLESMKMGVQPVVECPNCEREFHARTSKLRCPFCKEEIQIVDRIAPGTPPIDYDGSGRYGAHPLSIEETLENPASPSWTTSTRRKPQKSTKQKKSEQKSNRSKHKNGREIEKEIER